MQPPGPGFPATLALLPTLVRDPLTAMRRVAHTYGDIVHVQLGPMRIYLLNHPDHVKHVLQDNYPKYRKSSIYHEFSMLLGEGQLTTNDMEYWRAQRKLIRPTFTPAGVERFAEQMGDSVAAMLDGWQAHANADAPLDVYPEFTRLLLRITGKILFGIDLSTEAPQVTRAMSTAFDLIMKRVNAPLKLPRDLPTPARRRVYREVGALDALILRLIEQRRRDGNEHADLLGALVSARDSDGAGMRDEHLRDEVKTLLVAGHESPANALAWACHLLATNVEPAQRLAAEVDNVLGDRTPTFADLARLPYCRMVLEETMRLYPPAWVVERTPMEDDEIGGYRIRAGARVTMFMYEIHRHPDFWPDPERFDPERFTEQRSATRHRFALFPFSGGPRICLGKDLAMVEMMFALAMLAQRFRLRPEPGHPVAVLPSVNLRPRHGIVVRISARGKTAPAPVAGTAGQQPA
jgi:cytochrome P450